MDKNLVKATLSLFKALPVDSADLKEDVKVDLSTIKFGFLWSTKVASSYSQEELAGLIKIVEDSVGLSTDKANNTFHKSWKKISEANIEQLVIEQTIHYITTYGFEWLGCYSDAGVYIPMEKLEIPNIDIKEIPLTVIKGYTKEQLKEKLMQLLSSGIALKASTIVHAVAIAKFVGISNNDVSSIKNKEVMTVLCDVLDLIPIDPAEFLRFFIFKTTGKTLLIKDRATIEAIKNTGKPDTAVALINDYKKGPGLSKLASIFHRMKPIFLAMKSNKALAPEVNAIRRLAVTQHKPMKADLLNSLTADIKAGKKIDGSSLAVALEKANTFRKVRAAYALNYRTGVHESISYKVRNGKSFSTVFSTMLSSKAAILDTRDAVLKSIVSGMVEKVSGKNIFVPEYMRYSLPATEKQFTGNFPSGTYVQDRDCLIVGVHWTDVVGEGGRSNRVDLDLSLISLDGAKYGWDARTRSGDRDILFSGDITAAPLPNGATELFRIKRMKKQAPGSYALCVNYFNYDSLLPVPFSIIAAKNDDKDFGKNYVIDPNKMLAYAPSIIERAQKILGFVNVSEEGVTFFFSEAYLGGKRSSIGDQNVKHTINYMKDFASNMIGLDEVLTMAGANMVADPEQADINLSPEIIERDTIMNLIA